MRSEPYKKELAFPITEEEARERTLQHLQLLADVEQLNEEKKAQTKEINETIKEKQKASKRLAKVIIDKIETRSVEVREVADWDTKRVLTVRRGEHGEDIVVDARGMTLDEQQQSLFKGKAPEGDEDDPEADKTAQAFDAELNKPTLSTKFRLVLEDAGEKPAAIVKELKSVFGTLGAAKSAVAAAPKVVLESDTKNAVEALAYKLEQLGATITIKMPEVQVEEKKALPPAVRKVDELKADAEKEPVVAPETQAELEKKFRKGMGVDKVKKDSKPSTPAREPKDRKSRK